jgi:hypothetical protein
MCKSNLSEPVKREVMAVTPDVFVGNDSDLVTVEEGGSYEEFETEQLYSGL